MTRRILSLLLALMLMSCLCLTVSAHSVPDLDTNCSITFNVRYDEKPINGGTLTMYRVGDIVEDDGNYFFRLTKDIDPYQNVEEDMSHDRAEEILGIAQAARVQAITVEIDDGKAVFTDIAPGLYVVAQLRAKSGYEEMSPFLISLPLFDGEKYLSHVEINPKVPIETEPPATTESTSQKPPQKAPQTGQLNWPVPVLTMSGLLLFAIGWALRFGRKKEEYEK